ncbi:alkaline phosphatase family protein [Amnibacterium sp. CER49]|uniref:alkaline phosphatase family protein n=1 Tax=Amnibacterium sp. CER49 TaxID=3039161 RepID=UPI002449EB81|nr:alkaline phosphatase family protein [Amnibacterium sp. CER49]MDH2443164.1 alkaline phosphatase family protein [Amnibacterium sp. CER49]
MPSRRWTLPVGAAGCAAALAVGALPAAAQPATSEHRPASRHVLLLSVDGLHESDLARYVRQHPRSALAGLVRQGRSYTRASATFPSDSFPGMVAQLTGADAGTSGVFYDDTYNHSLLPAGTTHCSGAAPGAEVSLTEAADRSQNPITLDAGQGIRSSSLAALPTNSIAQTLAAAPSLTTAILQLTSKPRTLLDPAALPVNPSSCTPVEPYQYLRVNTVFEVAHAAGLRTAWSDKHPAYDILNGPSGNGIDDLFTPEINSVADAAGDDWTTDNALTQEYDSFKVQAVLNEIDGYDHSRTHRVGEPAVFGMNFQTVSTAEKLPVSDGLKGGYTSTGAPGPLLQRALDSVDRQVGRMLAELRHEGRAGSTTVILSAKHGQSPILPQQLRRVDDGKVLDGLNAAWKAAHSGSADLVSFSVNDDGMLLWLSDRSSGAVVFARHYLLTHSAPANTINDPKGVYSTTVASSGLSAVFVGTAAARLVDAKAGDPRRPDLIGIAQQGVVYTGGVKKIAEHGGAAFDDRAVPLVVAGAGVHHAGSASSAHVATTQIAPTILALLGLDPNALRGVRIDGTRTLPGLR